MYIYGFIYGFIYKYIFIYVYIHACDIVVAGAKDIWRYVYEKIHI
jgi:hypothetical protein